jgi:hydroxymethylpyrimidine pyrophosphatase-like HAD family hydrolase
MARLKALYVDLDNTLLGAHASILHDGDGKVSNLGFRAIEACHRADVEVIIMSGRRRAQVMEDARLLGSRSYIFEAGAAVVDGPDIEWLTAPYMPDEGSTVNELVERAGAPQLLLEHFSADLEYHDPWHLSREVSHLFRGAVDVRDADALLQEHGFGDLRLLDNGAIDRPGMRGYHLVPRGVSKGAAVARHMRVRGYAPEECIAAGDSREDLTAADAVGTFWLVANALDKDPLLVGNLPRNAKVAEAGHGAGVYEAVVTELSERR